MNPDMEEIVTISSKIDENILLYTQDEFGYEADMTALENSDFDIPDLDAVITPNIGTETSDERNVTCVADEVTDITEIASLNDNNETIEEVFSDDDFHTYHNDDSISTNNHDNCDKIQESSFFSFDEDF